MCSHGAAFINCLLTMCSYMYVCVRRLLHIGRIRMDIDKDHTPRLFNGWIPQALCSVPRSRPRIKASRLRHGPLHESGFFVGMVGDFSPVVGSKDKLETGCINQVTRTRTCTTSCSQTIARTNAVFEIGLSKLLIAVPSVRHRAGRSSATEPDLLHRTLLYG
jgi:hypothetical protein